MYLNFFFHEVQACHVTRLIGGLCSLVRADVPQVRLSALIGCTVLTSEYISPSAAADIQLHLLFAARQVQQALTRKQDDL